MKQYLFVGLIALFTLGSCSNKSASGHEEHSHSHETCNHNHEGGSHKHEGDSHIHENDSHNSSDNHGSDEIILSPEKAQAIGVKVEIVRPGTFHQVIKTGGQVLTAQGDESTVVAPVSGVVAFRGTLTEGGAVSKGTILLTLSSRHLATGDQVQRARTDYEIAQKEYERMKGLAASKIVSEKELAQARQTFENARLAYQAIADNSSDKGVGVTAPIGGFVKNLLVKEGDYVEIGTPLATVAQNRNLYLRADVSQKYYASLASIGSANFRTPYNNKVYQLADMKGRLLSYGKNAGTDGHYIPVTFEFANQGDIVPGSYVEVYLLSTPMTNVISLPHTALTEEQGSYFVYLQVDDEGYKKQLVTLGADNGERVQILSGVQQDESVVTQGAYQVKLASAASAIPAHTHEH
ncbi:MAG: efflux RND transporter periplasmic adaptor subunit [Mediterranea sp.]|jgi:RND family efflux transporter MFP subunit|nr:efflux RND transporter periplasmic adaptor subunit [Mediterranea sp.]